MNKTEINQTLHQIYQKIYQADIEDEENLFLKSGDSIIHMAFASLICDTFDMRISIEEYENNTSLGKLTNLIFEKSNQVVAEE